MIVGTNKFLSGSTGQLWFGGELLANLSKVDIKAEGDFKDVTCAGDNATYSQYTGYSVSGSITLHKVNSMVLTRYAAAYLHGVMPDLKIISKLTDANTGESERVAVTGAVLTTIQLIGFEAKGMIDEELPIKASGYEILEEIV